jgi:hypothetical protein
MLTVRLSHRSGQAATEMAFGFLIFFTFFMGIVEFSHLLYAKVTLQHALGIGGRYMITGATQPDQQGNPRPRDQMVHDVFCANVIAAGVQCPPLGPDFQFVCIDGPCTEPGGGPEQTVSVTVHVGIPTLMPFFSRFFPAGGVPIQLGTTWKNEPFPQT